MIARLVALALGAGVGLLLFAPQRPALPAIAAAPTAAPASRPQRLAAANDREQWAIDLLAGLGNTAPTPATTAFVVEWTLAEDGSSGAFDRNNPLNTTQDGFHATHSINGDGVKGYASRADGLAATLQTLSYGYYTDIVAALRANDPAAAKAALRASPWAASHYGGGAGWPHSTIEGAS